MKALEISMKEKELEADESKEGNKDDSKQGPIAKASLDAPEVTKLDVKE